MPEKPSLTFTATGTLHYLNGATADEFFIDVDLLSPVCRTVKMKVLPLDGSLFDSRVSFPSDFFTTSVYRHRQKTQCLAVTTFGLSIREASVRVLWAYLKED